MESMQMPLGVRSSSGFTRNELSKLRRGFSGFCSAFGVPEPGRLCIPEVSGPDRP